MKKKISRKIKSRKQKMDRQLEKAVQFNFGGPVLRDVNSRYPQNPPKKNNALSVVLGATRVRPPHRQRRTSATSNPTGS